MADQKIVRRILLVGVLVILMWIATIQLLFFFFPGENGMEMRGQFGDMFGALNSLFTGFAFVGLFYTAWLQRKQLEAQQAQLDNQRVQSDAQKEDLKNQRDLMLAQTEYFRAQLRAIQSEAAPVIEWIRPESIPSGDGGWRYYFFNRGGAFKITRTHVSEGGTHGHTSHRIENGQKGFVGFRPQSGKPFQFWIHFKSNSDDDGELRFKVPDVSKNPEPIEE